MTMKSIYELYQEGPRMRAIIDETVYKIIGEPNSIKRSLMRSWDYGKAIA